MRSNLLCHHKRKLPLALLCIALTLGLLGGVTGCEFPVRRMACTVAERGLIPDAPSPFPPVSAADRAQGPDGARVTFIAYLDPRCRRSAELHRVLAALQAQYPDEVRVVVRLFPLESLLHYQAQLAAQALEAADAQGQFWDMLTLLFEQQELWSSMDPARFEGALAELAAQLGLDAGRFAADLGSESTLARVEQAYADAIALGLSDTPALAINGQYYEGPLDAWTLGATIELLRLEARQFHECPPLQAGATKALTATLHTTQGDIVIALLPEQAPLAVNNFIFLARQGWYDNVPFHRVIPETFIQTGDPSGTGLGGPGYTFADELAPGASFDQAGMVGMAGAATAAGKKDNNGSQFFITTGPQPALDGQHTLFGRVIAGMDVAAKLTPRDPVTDPTDLPEPDRILSVEISSP